MERIANFILVLTKFRPLCGSTFLDTAEWLKNKMAVVNVKNTDDKCFIYAIRSALYPAVGHPNRITHYRPYENATNVTGLTFPLAVRGVPRLSP